ncbi:PRC-barrel domain-containing protein [Lichenibacterium minor]|nr:PRC-barrel domain-containing protein [Lichenibacterium minor]
MTIIPFSFAAALALAPLLSPAAALAQSGPFLAGQGPDLWRASRLVGVDVLGPDGKPVGTVSDVLLDHDGRAVAAVVGVGGFLGLGRKDVALPFASLHFTQEPRPGASAVGTPDSANGMPTEPGMAAGSAVPVETAAAPPGATAAPARSTARPDHATVDVTAEELKAAPAFTFAR